MDTVVKRIIEQARKDPSVIAVALFGSYARREQYQDIDVCIFLRPGNYPSGELFEKQLKYTPAEEKYDVHLFQQLPVYIRKRILKEAKILYCKNEDLLYDLYFATLRDYLHYEPIYESYLEAVEHG